MGDTLLLADPAWVVVQSIVTLHAGKYILSLRNTVSTSSIYKLLRPLFCSQLPKWKPPLKTSRSATITAVFSGAAEVSKDTLSTNLNHFLNRLALYNICS